ncbi:protein ALP1-like isoform X1 [Hyalella azteca]|uniref:Protein ALP1-like isoform X1 n=1 Tax=Hyalella azteca TaxID=294128 RepID=A0A8B7NB99_HYAAZ|nr:protein ALP1-like isoform X1 [Hyalella azteca]
MASNTKECPVHSYVRSDESLEHNLPLMPACAIKVESKALDMDTPNPVIQVPEIYIKQEPENENSDVTVKEEPFPYGSQKDADVSALASAAGDAGCKRRACRDSIREPPEPQERQVYRARTYMMESSSSDEDYLLLDSILPKVKRKRMPVHDINRRRKDLGEYHHLFRDLKNDKSRFFAYARMTQETFNYILKRVEHRLVKQWCNLHQQPIQPEERLIITLRYLATGASFHTLSFSFRVGVSTVSKIVSETVGALWEELHEQHMPVPTKECFRKIAEDFYKIWNFPNCIGSIDDKHIRVKCPSNSGSMYYNYKQFYSIVLQAVADANYKFVFIDIGGFGKQSDGGTFQASELSEALKYRNLDIPEPAFLPNTAVKVPYVLVGDEAYPLMPFLLKPYGGHNLTIEDITFNQCLSRCRKTIECAFGIIFSKWRLLATCIDTKVEVIDSIVKCICVLHNTIIDKEGIEHHLTETVNSGIEEQNPVHQVGRLANDAVDVREIFKNFLLNNPLLHMPQT